MKYTSQTDFENNITPPGTWHEIARAQWTQYIKREPFFISLLSSKAFRRLENISFLGALDYTCTPSRKSLKPAERSRADHSLHVAALAAFISSERGYSADLQRHIIVAALVHDIGHPPLSHSAEPHIQKKLGYGHHELGERLILGHGKLGQELRKLLDKSINIDFILNLLNKKISDQEGGDLFSSNINIDTIDGIIRSYRYMSDSLPQSISFAIARASFTEKTQSNNRFLDMFWDLKHEIYSRLINTRLGLLSDKTSEYFFSVKNSIDESDLLKTESTWQEKHRELFLSLKNIKENIKSTPKWMENISIEYTKKIYSIDKTKKQEKRYIHSKIRDTYTFEPYSPATNDSLNRSAQEELNFGKTTTTQERIRSEIQRHQHLSDLLRDQDFELAEKNK